ncbi:MAG: type II toxin-antitoxin system RelE/ParE family toxin, partial [Burkholderiales bacterium]
GQNNPGRGCSSRGTPLGQAVMHYEFHPDARVEYLDAVDYYEDRQAGLGARFTIEVERTIQRIVEAPTRCCKIDSEIRRCLAHTFPYGILYSVEVDHVLVLAIMHHSRKPGYWRSRLSSRAG